MVIVITHRDIHLSVCVNTKLPAVSISITQNEGCQDFKTVFISTSALNTKHRACN